MGTSCRSWCVFLAVAFGPVLQTTNTNRVLRATRQLFLYGFYSDCSFNFSFSFSFSFKFSFSLQLGVSCSPESVIEITRTIIVIPTKIKITISTSKEERCASATNFSLFFYFLLYIFFSELVLSSFLRLLPWDFDQRCDDVKNKKTKQKSTTTTTTSVTTLDFSCMYLFCFGAYSEGFTLYFEFAKNKKITNCLDVCEYLPQLKIANRNSKRNTAKKNKKIYFTFYLYLFLYLLIFYFIFLTRRLMGFDCSCQPNYSQGSAAQVVVVPIFLHIYTNTFLLSIFFSFLFFSFFLFFKTDSLTYLLLIWTCFIAKRCRHPVVHRLIIKIKKREKTYCICPSL